MSYKNLIIPILFCLTFSSIAEDLDMEFMKNLSDGMVEQELINSNTLPEKQDSSINKDAPYSKKDNCTGVLGFKDNQFQDNQFQDNQFHKDLNNQFQKNLEFMYGTKNRERIKRSNLADVSKEVLDHTLIAPIKKLTLPTSAKAASKVYSYGKKMYDINEGYKSNDFNTYLDKIPWKTISVSHKVAYEDFNLVGNKMDNFLHDLEKRHYNDQDKLVPIPVKNLEPYINTSYDPTNDINASTGSLSPHQTLSNHLHNKTPTYLEYRAKHPNTDLSEYFAKQSNIKYSPIINYSKYLDKQAGIDPSKMKTQSYIDILSKQPTFDPSKMKTPSYTDFVHKQPGFDPSKIKSNKIDFEKYK
jgi:hypothetical protein